MWLNYRLYSYWFYMGLSGLIKLHTCNSNNISRLLFAGEKNKRAWFIVDNIQKAWVLFCIFKWNVYIFTKMYVCKNADYYTVFVSFLYACTWVTWTIIPLNRFSYSMKIWMSEQDILKIGTHHFILLNYK